MSDPHPRRPVAPLDYRPRSDGPSPSEAGSKLLATLPGIVILLFGMPALLVFTVGVLDPIMGEIVCFGLCVSAPGLLAAPFAWVCGRSFLLEPPAGGRDWPDWAALVLYIVAGAVLALQALLAGAALIRWVLHGIGWPA